MFKVPQSWLNQFRNLLMHYVKRECSILALDHLTSAIIAVKDVPMVVNIIYG